jgi:hypothetical protein
MSPERGDAIHALVSQNEPVSVDLNLVEARWRLGLITASDLHELASSLLDEGVESESLIELFALPTDEVIWSGSRLFEKALVEVGRGELTDDEAARAVAYDLARRVLDGSLRPPEALAQAASIHVSTGYRFDVFHRLYTLDDEIGSLDADARSYLGRSEPDIVEDVRIEARRIADHR